MYTQRNWKQHWTSKNTPWTQKDADAELKRHWKKISKLGVGAGSSVLVPLCGNSKALAFLHSKKLSICGVEYVPQAVTELLRKRFPRTRFRSKKIPRGRLFTAPSLSIYQMDFFKLKMKNEFDFIYDRAALIAIPPKKRAAYVRILQNALKPGGVLFVDTFTYRAKKLPGPPFPVPKSSIKKLFPRCDVLSFKEISSKRRIPPHLGKGFLPTTQRFTLLKKRK